MINNTGYPSPYSRMDTLAREVCSTQLRKSRLEPTLKELYPDGKVPDYFTLHQVILDRLKIAMRQAFSQDECLLELKDKIDDSIDSVEEYSTRPQSINHIDKALENLGYQPPARTATQKNWCILS